MLRSRNGDTLVLALAAIVGLCACSAKSPSPVPAQLQGWSSSVPLPGLRVNSLIHSSQLAARGESVFLVGNLYPDSGTSAPPRPLFLAGVPGGTNLGLPAGDFQFVFPKIAIRSNGAIDIVWAEFDAPVARLMMWSNAIQTTLWHARLQDGTWSKPEQIFRAKILQWTEDDGHLAIDRNGRLHAAVWAQRDSISGVFHLVEDPGGWRIVPVAGGILHSGAAVGTWRSSTFIAYDTGFGDEEGKGLTVARLAPDGSSAKDSVTLRLLQRRRVVHPTFLEANGSIFLAWSEQPEKKTSFDSLRIARWDDAAARWIHARSIELPEGTNKFALAVSPCGEFAALTEAFTMKPSVIELSFDMAGPTRVDTLLAGRLTALSAIAVTPTRFVAVLGTTEGAGRPAYEVSMSRALRAPSCPSR